MGKATEAGIEKEYFVNGRAMISIFHDGSDKYQRVLGDLFRGVISIAEYKIITKGFIGVIKECYATYLGLKPSKRLEKSHDMFSKAVEHCLNIATFLQQHIDTDDLLKMARYLSLATAEINLSTEYLGKFTEEFKKLTE